MTSSTVKFIQTAEGGHYDPATGNYTGAMGHMINGSCDGFYQALRPGGLVGNPPVEYASTMSGINLHVMHSIGNATERPVEPIDVFNKMDFPAYAACATCFDC